MSFSKWTLFLLLLGLTGCGNNSGSGGGAPPAAPSPQPTVNSTDYLQAVNLNLYQTSVDVLAVKNNLVSIRGVGGSRPYKILYTFNSKNSNTFQITSTNLLTYSPSCPVPQVTLTLKGKGSSRDLKLLEVASIDANTDYGLEVNFTKSCDQLDLDFSLTAWAGNTNEDARMAVVCANAQNASMTFFMNSNMLTAFSAMTGREKFFTPDSFCGEEFRPFRMTCFSRKGFNSVNTHTECTAARGGDKRTITVDYSSADGSAVVKCSDKYEEFYSEVFHSCQTRMMDFKPYGKFITNFYQ